VLTAWRRKKSLGGDDHLHVAPPSQVRTTAHTPQVAAGFETALHLGVTSVMLDPEDLVDARAGDGIPSEFGPFDQRVLHCCTSSSCFAAGWRVSNSRAKNGFQILLCHQPPSVGHLDYVSVLHRHLPFGSSGSKLFSEGGFTEPMLGGCVPLFVDFRAA